MALDVAKILENLAARHQGKRFVYQDKELDLETAFSPSGALPVLVKRANLLSDFLFGEKLQVSLQGDPDALTGEKVVVDDKQPSFVLVMLLYDVLEEMIVNAGQGDVVLS